MKRYCSNCFQKTEFSLVQENFVSRNRYICENCETLQVKCRVINCDAMALTTKIDKKKKEVVDKKLGNTLCAEHNGSIINFQTVNKTIASLHQYETKIMIKRGWNWKKIGLQGAITAVAATVTFFTAGAAAPAVAAKAGAMGALGAAGTGTAISTLSGAALTSASLAAIGGTVAGGIAVLTAIGAAFGAWRGGAIAQSYFGTIKPFKIRKIKSGRSDLPAVIYINGFMSKLELNRKEWKSLLKKTYPDHTVFEIEWESKALKHWLGMLLNGRKFLKFLGRKAVKKAGKTVFSLGFDLFDSPFHQAMYKSQATGVILADAIARTPEASQYILMGHSLGARVAFNTMLCLAKSQNNRNGLNRISEVHLFGGAVGTNKKEVDEIKKLNLDQVNNYYSKNDEVLNRLYKVATAGFSNPIGRGPIKGARVIKNHNVSDFVSGHTKYVENAHLFLDVFGNPDYVPHVTSKDMDFSCPHCARRVLVHSNKEYQCTHCHKSYVKKGFYTYAA